MADLLIDVGSTFIKYSVYEKGKFALQQKIKFPEPLINEGERFTVSLESIRNAIFDIFEKCDCYKCEKAFFSVQMHGFVLKKKDGSFSDYISWRDMSGDISAAELGNIDFEAMGTSLKRNLPAAKLFLYDDGEFFTLGSYISYMLTGVNATHITDACASGFFFAETGKENEISKGMKKPKAYKSVTEVGYYKKIRIYTPVGDHQTSFLGSGAGDKKYLLNIGTATQLSCLDNDKIGGKHEKRPYFNSMRLHTVSGLVGGGRIIDGEGFDELFDRIIEAMKLLPKKNAFTIGGGGGAFVSSYLKEKLEALGFEVTLSKNNIGIEGLKMIADNMIPKMGTMLSEITFPNFPIIAKNCGLDFFILDNEHGYFDYGDIARLTLNSRLCGMDMIVRIGDSGRAHITKLADMGVNGFLLPMTNTAKDIEQVIKYAKYPPIGKRGVSTTRAHTLYDPPSLSEYMPMANEKMKIFAQIETVEGLENIDDILATDAVDGIFIGPNDLSVDMNCIGDKDMIIGAITKIMLAAEKAQKSCGIITGDKKLLSAALGGSIQMVCVGSELNMLINGCKKIKEDIKNVNG